MLIRVLYFVSKYKAARELWHTHYSDEMYVMFWNAVPYLFFSALLLWRQISLRQQGEIAALDIKAITDDSKTVIEASVVGLLLYFFSDIPPHNDWGVAHMIMPFIQFTVYIVIDRVRA
jgi:hypothetical protein